MRGLQVKARFRATIHFLRHIWPDPTKHEVWRIYSWFGFDTRRVFCSCGKEFTTPLPCDPPLGYYLDLVKKRTRR